MRGRASDFDDQGEKKPFATSKAPVRMLVLVVEEEEEEGVVIVEVTGDDGSWR